jgi:hypothetical protein
MNQENFREQWKKTYKQNVEKVFKIEEKKGSGIKVSESTK